MGQSIEEKLSVIERWLRDEGKIIFVGETKLNDIWKNIDDVFKNTKIILKKNKVKVYQVLYQEECGDYFETSSRGYISVDEFISSRSSRPKFAQLIMESEKEIEQ